MGETVGGGDKKIEAMVAEADVDKDGQIIIMMKESYDDGFADGMGVKCLFSLLDYLYISDIPILIKPLINPFQKVKKFQYCPLI